MNDFSLTMLSGKPWIPKPLTPAEIAQRSRAVNFAVFNVLVILSLVIYVRTLCPTIFTDDCGEIATAVATGGVIHPPGYPLYTLLGQLFIAFFDTGEPAWRLGLLSAVCGAASVGVTYLLSRRLGAGIIWASTAAIGFAFSVTLWQQATKVETYTLNALLIGILWLQVARYDELPTLKRLCILSLCAGLALTNHLTSICAVAGTLVAVSKCMHRSRSNRVVSSLVAFLVALLPLCLYCMIWFNAEGHPNGQIWGNPSNWRSLYLHISGARYHAYFQSQNSLEMVQRDLINLPAILWHNIGPLLILIVPGAGRAIWCDGPQRRLGVALLISAAAYLLETTIYGILNIFEYYTPIVLVLCVLAGVGGEAVFAGLKKLSMFQLLPSERWIACTCMVATLLGAVIVHWPYCDRSNATFIRDLALNTLNSVPKNSVVIATGDNRVFPMWYAQDVLGVRRDVTVVPRHAMDTLSGTDGILMMSWLVNKLNAQHPDVVNGSEILERASKDPNYSRNEGPTWDIAVSALTQNIPLFISDIQPSDTHMTLGQREILNPIGPNLMLSPYGLLDKVVPVKKYTDLAKRTALNKRLLLKMSINVASNVLMEDEPDGNITNIVYGKMLARDSTLLSRSGQLDDAYRTISTALQYQPTAENYNSRAAISLANMKLVDAIEDYEAAIKLDPENDDYKADLKIAQTMTHVANGTEYQATGGNTP